MRVAADGGERRIYVEAPEAEMMGEFPQLADAVSSALGRPIAPSPPPTALMNGPNWLFVRFEDEADVAALRPDMSAVARLSQEHTLSGIAAFAFTSFVRPEEPGDPAARRPALGLRRVHHEDSPVPRPLTRVQARAPYLGTVRPALPGRNELGRREKCHPAIGYYGEI
jgi:hypothetical protein